jgi:hypothetical protein
MTIQGLEKILRLAAGEPAPLGYEIVRLLGTFERLTGTGGNSETIHVVAVREIEEDGEA